MISLGARSFFIVVRVIGHGEDAQDVCVTADGGRTIDLPSDIEYQFPVGVKEGGYVEQIPERFAVFLVIEEEFYGFFSCFDRGFEALSGAAVSVVALEETAVAGNNFGSAIACHVDEAVGGVDDGVVGSCGIRKAEAVA